MNPGHIPRNTTITRSSNVHISTEAGLPSMTMDPTSMCTGSVPCAMADGSDAVLRTLPPGYHTLPYSSQVCWFLINFLINPVQPFMYNFIFII